MSTLANVTGYRRSPQAERNDAQLFAPSHALRIRQSNSLDFSNVATTSPLGTVANPNPERFSLSFAGRRPPKDSLLGSGEPASLCNQMTPPPVALARRREFR